jgi:hypothetical protein
MNLPLLLAATLALTASANDSAFVRPLPSPAAPTSQCPNLAAGPDGTLYLTFCAPGDRDGERALRLATLAPGASAWSAPRTIVSTPLLLENWADFASLVVGTDGALTAQWFQKSSANPHSYSGWFARSTDGGATWTPPAPLGHEFVTLAPLAAGRTLAVWLKSIGGRDPEAPPEPGAPYAPAMKLAARLLAPDGSSLGEWTVDPDVCTCCQIALAPLPDGRVFVAYRGHTAGEIRDNFYAIFDGHAWSAPRPLRPDRWKIPACPVNGPAADARGPALAIAWFTAADGVAKVQALHSSDAGRTLGAPVRIDLGRPMGRLETVMLPDSSALILWTEMGAAANAAGLYVRRLFPDGRLSAARPVTDFSQARAGGFPRAALRPNGRVVVAWTQTGEPTQIRLCEIDPSGLSQ